MKFAAIADIHGNAAALEAVLADISRKGITDIANLGDSLSGPLDPAATADRLIALGLPTVAGNHDRQLIDRAPEEMGQWEVWTYPHLSADHLDWVRSLPATLVWNDVFLCHATPHDDQTNWMDERGADRRMHFNPRDVIERFAVGVEHSLILCAHTHIPRMVRLSGGRVLVNPGSVGCPAYLDDREDLPFVAETGAPDARYAILEELEGAWRVELCSVPYNPSPMIERARTGGGESWAEALTSGWFTPQT